MTILIKTFVDGSDDEFNDDEKAIFADIMIDALQDDKKLRKLLMLSADSDELYDVLSDGLILW